MDNVIDETLLQTYLLDILVKLAIETKGKYNDLRVNRMKSEKRYIESTLITLHKAELINKDTYRRLCYYFSRVTLKDCEI